MLERIPTLEDDISVNRDHISYVSYSSNFKGMHEEKHTILLGFGTTSRKLIPGYVMGPQIMYGINGEVKNIWVQSDKKSEESLKIADDEAKEIAKWLRKEPNKFETK